MIFSNLWLIEDINFNCSSDNEFSFSKSSYLTSILLIVFSLSKEKFDKIKIENKESDEKCNELIKENNNLKD